MSRQRSTVQRELVLETVNNLRNHPTAEEIYTDLRARHPSISRGTVYRNLGVLSQQGDILRVTHLNAADRFDFNTQPHYHFRCLSCGRVFDSDLPYKENLIAEVPNREGFLIEGCEITFTGRCPACTQ